ncbi:hypothetical protein MMC19_006333 [Ptychographa xylographoides]|nr:hypothetical protein [Ptychographa xylographoides]
MVSRPTSPRSPHISDPLLRPFLAPTFDATAYLNSTLPSLSFPTPLQQPRPNTLTLHDLATRTQSHVAQLSAQTSRLTATLTALTDDILRSGSRLAYEVEVLRGEAVALSETLTDNLASDIEQFLPAEFAIPSGTRAGQEAVVLPPPNASRNEHAIVGSGPGRVPEPVVPEALTSLRTLQIVRLSLQSIMSTFDAALSWPLPPSAVTSTTSSLISISSPSNDLPALEVAGQEASQRLRNEIKVLLAMGSEEEGVLAAEKRVDELRSLVSVWRGTVEEKPRGRFVDGLEKMVGERRKEVEQRGGLSGQAKYDRLKDGENVGRKSEEAKGVWRGLQRLREEMYLD